MSKRYSNAVQYDDEATENVLYSGYNNSYDNISTQSSPYNDNGSISSESKKIRKKRNTYQKIDDETRIKLLDAVQQGDTLKAAAKKYNINYSSAKSILHTFRKEGRILKKSAQERTARKRTKTSNELEMSPIYYNQCQDEGYLMQGTTNYKTYHSPDSHNRSEPTSAHFAGHYEASPKPIVTGMSINSFGGFLKIDNQSQPKAESLNMKAPASTISFKLDSQRLQRVPSVTSKGLQSGNWQLNVNVHNEPTQAIHKPIDALNQESQYEHPTTLKMSNKLKSYESFYMNYANSPLSVVGHMKRQESFGVNAFADAVAGYEGNQEYQAQAFDISNFLCSSPPLDFQLNQADSEHFGIGNFALYDNFMGMTEPQEMFSDKPKKNAYIDNFKAKMADVSGLKGY